MDSKLANKFCYIYVGTILQPTERCEGRTVHVRRVSAVAVNYEGFISAVFVPRNGCGAEHGLDGWIEEQQRLLGGSVEVRRLGPLQFLVPGLVDTHIHAPQYSFTGTATDVPLMEWLQRFTFPSESRLKDVSLARRVYTRVVCACIAEGTTTALYFATKDLEPSKVLVDVALELGQRAYVGKVNMDRNSPDYYTETTENSLRDTEAFIEYVLGLKSPLVQPVVTPRFLPTCSAALLRGLGTLAANYGVRVQSHIAESADLVNACQDLAHAHNGHHRDTLVLDQCGLLTPLTVLAHGVHLSSSELELLRHRGSGISHCPLSNFFFANGVLPARRIMDMGVKVGLGTDVAGGYSCSVLTAVRSTVIASRVLEDGCDRYRHGERTQDPCSAPVLVSSGATRIDWQEGLWMATMGGAELLGLQHIIGSFAAGKAFDAILIDASQLSAFEEEGMDEPEDVVQKWVNLGDDRHILEVYVQGRRIKAAGTS